MTYKVSHGFRRGSINEFTRMLFFQLFYEGRLQ